MSKIKCELFCNSNIEHLQLIYTGFRLLEKQGKIKFYFHIHRNQPAHLPKHYLGEILVKLNDTKLLLFDMRDFGNIQEDCLDQIDFYFKRSFSPRIVGPEVAFHKVFPLGLGYEVHEKSPSLFSLERVLLEQSPSRVAKSFIRELMAPLGLFHPLLYRLHMDNCFAKPDPSLPPGIIFMAKLWDPSKAKPKERNEREMINMMRVDCIRRLRREFGSIFLGGLAHDEYASRYFPDCLLKDARQAYFGNYIRLVRQYPIGVATTGLHSSIGWKFAEYVAFSRAIVSEKLHFEAPGLEVGKHFLEFTSVDQCAEAVSTLVHDGQLRAKMMYDNHEYYQTKLRPDMLVWNALAIAIENSG